MTQPAYELPLGEVGDHVADLRRAAEHGDVVYLTERGERLAAVIPLHRPMSRPVASGRLAAVVGTLSDFERFVDVEASRDSWDGQ
jgi:antitoxin (DNA-binding transcriptional repressor) of toxin-antitoxin stability system